MIDPTLILDGLFNMLLSILDGVFVAFLTPLFGVILRQPVPSLSDLF